MATTEIQAREIHTAIGNFQSKDQQVIQAQFDADKAVAVAWYDSLGIDIQGATTRTQASDNYSQIDTLLQTETDRFRLLVLRQRLAEANERYREIKRLNT